MLMPAGHYYIGDLCYVMNDDEWDQCVNLFFPPGESESGRDGEFVLKDGRRFASFGTAYGDGIYRSNIGTSHSVDSGSIGCIRQQDILTNKYPYIESLGAFVTFASDFSVSEQNGVIQFGHMLIDTK